MVFNKLVTLFREILQEIEQKQIIEHYFSLNNEKEILFQQAMILRLLKNFKLVKQIAEIVNQEYESNITLFKNRFSFYTIQVKKINNLTNAEKNSIITNHFVKEILFSYLKKNRCQFDSSKVEELLANWIEYLTLNSIELYVKSPLLNFKIEHDELKLNNNTIIRKISDQERKFQKNRSWNHLYRYWNPEFILEHYITLNLDKAPEFDFQDLFYRYFCVFSLIKEGWIHLGYSIEVIPQSLFESSTFDFGMPGPVPSPQIGSIKYSISKQEETSFKETWDQVYTTLSTIKELPMWIRKYMDSLAKYKIEDALLDLTISLESLFSDSNTEMTHKVSTRAAILLEKDLTERKTIRQKIKRFYNKRSKIVHGSGGKVTFQDVKELRNYVRRIIRMILVDLYCYLPGNDWNNKKSDLLEHIDFGKLNQLVNSC